MWSEVGCGVWSEVGCGVWYVCHSVWVAAVMSLHWVPSLGTEAKMIFTVCDGPAYAFIYVMVQPTPLFM